MQDARAVGHGCFIKLHVAHSRLHQAKEVAATVAAHNLALAGALATLFKEL
jgi:hypothetical protein